MLRIASCDDDILQRDILKEFFDMYIKKHPDTISASIFASGSDLLKAAEKEPFDIYLLDLIMPEINGMDVARKLRDSKSKGKIVFLTATKDYVFDAFSVNASDYLIKPIQPEKLFEMINRLKTEIEESEPKSILIKSVSGEFYTTINNIAYIENVSRAPYFHLLDGTVVEGVSKREKFSTVISEFIDAGFVFCNISTAVNLACVKSFRKDCGAILLVNDQELFCSRTMLKEFKIRLNDYLG